MFRVLKKFNTKAIRRVNRKFSTPSQDPAMEGVVDNKNRNNMILATGIAVVAGVLYVSHGMETDPTFEKKMADVPGIGMLDPVRSGLVNIGIVTKDMDDARGHKK